MLKQRVGRRISQVDRVHVPTFAAGCLLEFHHQYEALELERDAALVRFAAVARQLRMIGQKGVRLPVLVQLVAILHAEQRIGADEYTCGVVRAIDAVHGRCCWQ